MQLALAILRALHFAATLVVFGELAFAWLLSPGRVQPRRSLGIVAASLVLAAASALAWLVVEAHNMGGQPMGEPLAPGTLATVLGQTFYGQVWLARMALMALLAACLVPLRRQAPWALPAAVALALAVLAMLAGMGHAAGGRGAERGARLAVDALHLVAAGAWVGTLVPLEQILAVAVAFVRAREATRRF